MLNKEKVEKRINNNDDQNTLANWTEAQNKNIEWQRKDGIIVLEWIDDMSFFIKFKKDETVKEKSGIIKLNDNLESYFYQFIERVNNNYY